MGIFLEGVCTDYREGSRWLTFSQSKLCANPAATPVADLDVDGAHVCTIVICPDLLCPVPATHPIPQGQLVSLSAHLHLTLFHHPTQIQKEPAHQFPITCPGVLSNPCLHDLLLVSLIRCLFHYYSSHGGVMSACVDPAISLLTFCRCSGVKSSSYDFNRRWCSHSIQAICHSKYLCRSCSLRMRSLSCW